MFPAEFRISCPLAVVLPVIGLSVGLSVTASANDGLGDIDVANTLTVEPEYVCAQPLYAVAVFGEEPAHLVWFVLDKSDAESKTYDRVFVDTNANGDLTDPDERFEFANNDRAKIDSLNLSSADGQANYADFSLRLQNPKSGIGIINVTYDDELRLGGGYPVNSDKYMQFTATKSEAPVVWFKPNAPFEFQRWIEQPLTIGGETDVKVFLGWKGRGPASFCSTLGHILPDDELVLATLEYTDSDGNTRFAEAEFPERC